MAQRVPTIAEINATIIAQLEGELNDNIPLLPRSFLRVLAKVLAGVYILAYKLVGFHGLQQFVQHASAETVKVGGKDIVPLALWGRLFGVGDRVPATRALLRVSIGVKTQGGTLPIGTAIINNSTRITYLTETTVDLDAETKTVDIRASGDATDTGGVGTAGNVPVGTELVFASTPSALEPTATVTAVLQVAANQESADAYRKRIQDRTARRPQGGASVDYRDWSTSVPGIVDAFPYKSNFPGQIDVYVEATAASSGNSDGIPTASQLAAVKAAIELDTGGSASRRPTGADVITVRAITRRSFDVEVHAISGVSDLTALHEDIEAAIEEYFLARRPFINGLTIPPRTDRISQTTLGGIVSDIVNAEGGLFSSLVVRTGGRRVDIYSLAIGELAKSGTVSFT